MGGWRTFTFFGKLWLKDKVSQPRNGYRHRLARWFVHKSMGALQKRGYIYKEFERRAPEIVFYFIDPNEPKPFIRRSAEGTFVVGIIFGDRAKRAETVFNHLYPVLAGNLCNVVVSICPPNGPESGWKAWFVTPERGVYSVEAEREDFFLDYVFERLKPIITSHLMLANRVVPGPEESFWMENEQALEVISAGMILGSWGLLPVPFDLRGVLNPATLEHIRELGVAEIIGYGNASRRANLPGLAFWMSGRGGKKDELAVIGQDVVLVTGYDLKSREIIVSARDGIKPRKASVDAIEHALIYKQNPEVGAIIHFHGWMNGVVTTEQNFPCGTIELAQSVAQLVREAPDPSRATIGIRNHGLTLTGPNHDDIFARVEGKVLRYVPMN